MTRSSQLLAGRKALVTGGTRGIGLAIAKRLLREGAEVCITGTHAQGVAPEGCDYLAVDFSDPSATLQFANEQKSAGFDILINNAGINKIGPFDQLEPDDFDRIQCVNVRAPFLLCQAVLLGMKAKQWGRIVTISSIFGLISKEFRAPYSASKFAVDGMTAALSAEVASCGILVNCVAPGFIDTELTRRVLGEQGMADLVARVPIRRMGQPDEIAAFVVWLAGPENSFITGQNIAIDGGFTRV